MVRVRVWAQSFPRDCETGCVIRIQERKGCRVLRVGRMVKVGVVALKVVVPAIPSNTQERALLEEDLHRIGCHGFLGKP